MTLIEAWNKCDHGGSIQRASGGLVVEKWIGDKPDMSPSIDRWIAENATSLPAASLMAGDWEIVTA